jgi:protein SCO1/2
MKRRELFTAFGQEPAAACKPGVNRMAHLLPNALFRDQDGRPVRFYDDLIKGRQVMVMMMYATCETFCPMATKRMVDLHHRALASRMGKDLFMVNVSLKPDEDTPAALKEYAKANRAILPGWTFVTGNQRDVDTLRYRLFSHDHIGIDLDVDLHAGVMKIINDPVQRWFHADVFASTRTVLEHIRWSDPPKSPAERRRDNARLQREIEHDIEVFGYHRTA